VLVAQLDLKPTQAGGTGDHTYDGCRIERQENARELADHMLGLVNLREYLLLAT